MALLQKLCPECVLTKAMAYSLLHASLIVTDGCCIEQVPEDVWRYGPDSNLRLRGVQLRTCHETSIRKLRGNV
ncbi:hypothetical protein QQP08_012579 [Theobroma cacao]|nr:hypothetical protein QQP08_012579 [Theobroma cacao]